MGADPVARFFVTAPIWTERRVGSKAKENMGMLDSKVPEAKWLAGNECPIADIAPHDGI